MILYFLGLLNIAILILFWSVLCVVRTRQTVIASKLIAVCPIFYWMGRSLLFTTYQANRRFQFKVSDIERSMFVIE